MANVYIFRFGSENLFKIGRTEGDVKARSKGLATGSPFRLTKFDVIETEHDSDCETYLKNILRSRRSLLSGGQEIYAITPEEMKSKISETREFLAEYVPKQEEADRLSKEETDGVLLQPGDPEWSIYRDLLAAREKEDYYRYQRELHENRLKLAIGKSEGLEGIATWKMQVSHRLDQAALQSEEPEIFKRYLKRSQTRFLRY